MQQLAEEEMIGKNPSRSSSVWSPCGSDTLRATRIFKRERNGTSLGARRGMRWDGVEGPPRASPHWEGAGSGPWGQLSLGPLTQLPVKCQRTC